MSDRPGVSTTVPDDARSLVLYSVTKQARKAKDGLDHRSISEMSRHLPGLHYTAIRAALAELQDEGLIRRGMNTLRGDGWGLTEAAENIEENFPKFLTSDVSRCVVSHKRHGTLGVGIPGVGPQANDRQEVPHKGNRSYGALLRTTPGNGEVRVLRGRDITKKPGRTQDPDTPFGLASYFRSLARENGFVWPGEVNAQALMRRFKEAKEAGFSAEDLRKIMRLFWQQPENIRGLGKPAWRVFLNRFAALTDQAGVRAHRAAVTSREKTKEEYLAWWASEPEQTPEEKDAEKARYLSWWRD